jgi:hypothetical protein
MSPHPGCLSSSGKALDLIKQKWSTHKKQQSWWVVGPGAYCWAVNFLLLGLWCFALCHSSFQLSLSSSPFLPMCPKVVPIYLSCTSSCASLPSWKPDCLCPSPLAEETCILETVPLLQMPSARFSCVWLLKEITSCHHCPSQVLIICSPMALSIPVVVAQDMVLFEESSNEQRQPHNKSVCCFKAMPNQVGKKAWLVFKNSKMCVYFQISTNVTLPISIWILARLLHWHQIAKIDICVGGRNYCASPMTIALVCIAHIASHSICQRKS